MNKIITFTFGTLLAGSIATQTHAAFDLIDRTEFHVAATYAKPSNNGLTTEINHFQTIFGDPDFLNLTVNRIEPGFAWNYMLGASTSIPNSDSRIFVDFERFNDYENQAEENAVGILFETGSTKNRVEMKQYEARLGFQHYMRFGPQFFLDLSAFAEYDKLKQVYTQQFAFNDFQNAPSNFTVAQRIENRMHGFGPGFGIKILGNPIQSSPHCKLFAGVMTALLYSNQESSFDWNNNFANIAVDFDSTNTILTKMTYDFGIDYSSKVMFEGEPMLFGFTLGFKYMNIVNALQNETNTLVVSPTEGAFPFEENSQDWGHAGPYLQFRVGGPKS